MNDWPVGVLLAAGQGKRFGGNKLQHSVQGDTPMLLQSAQTLVSVLPGAIVVINSTLLSYTTQLETMGLQVVVNAHAEQGIGSSIACAVAASRDAPGWLIALADMPYIETNTVRMLVEKMQVGTEIVAPVYKGKRGHPVGFSQHFRDELLALREDVGAREIIKKHQDRLELVTVNDAGVIKDIDYQ